MASRPFLEFHTVELEEVPAERRREVLSVDQAVDRLYRDLEELSGFSNVQFHVLICFWWEYPIVAPDSDRVESVAGILSGRFALVECQDSDSWALPCFATLFIRRISAFVRSRPEQAIYFEARFWATSDLAREGSFRRLPPARNLQPCVASFTA